MRNYRRQLAMLSCMLASVWIAAAAADLDKALPEPTATSAPAGSSETAVLAGGCFWGMQGVFQHIKGVQQVLAGYSGGEKRTAEYETVSTGTTGHAESVEIKFNPAEVSYGELLRVFFSVAHDPTELNRQGPDEGTQYRSSIFYASAQQQQIAQAYIAQLNQLKVFRHPIVTRVDALKAFYPAEGYHQDYLLHNPENPYIATFDIPKVENLRRVYPALYRNVPVTVSSAQARSAS